MCCTLPGLRAMCYCMSLFESVSQRHRRRSWWLVNNQLQKINNRFPKNLSFTTLILSNKFKHTYYRHISWIIAPSGWLYKIKRNMLLLLLVIKCTESKQTDKNEWLFWPRTETKFSQSLQKWLDLHKACNPTFFEYQLSTNFYTCTSQKQNF